MLQIQNFIEALRSVELLFERALPKFNWAASPLDAQAIRLLNEVPLEVGHALRDLPEQVHLTVTTTPTGEAVMVSWQDEEHRILHTVWEREAVAAGLTPEQEGIVRYALGRAWNLGQNYWDDANSDSLSRWRRADQTKEAYQAHVEDTIKKLSNTPGQEVVS